MKANTEGRSLTPSLIQRGCQATKAPASGVQVVEPPAEAEAVSGGQELLLTLAETAERLRCSKTHVSNLIRDRVPGSPPLPAVRLGRRVYVRRSSLGRYLRAIEARYDGGGQDSTP